MDIKADECEIPGTKGGQVLKVVSFESSKAHLLSAIAKCKVDPKPFCHAYIEAIFPQEIYDRIRGLMLEKKYGGEVQDRLQDSSNFANKRFSLASSQDEIVRCVRALFSDINVKIALLEKFYVGSCSALATTLEIHKEFEFFFTTAGRFQNIHVDIPPKFLSFVFYIPELDIRPVDELQNGTVLYDKNLRPQYKVRFQANAACVFAPHFSSYHGFNSTIDRDVMVMFYVDHNELQTWRQMIHAGNDAPPFSAMLDEIGNKLRRHPLLEFSDDELAVDAERDACLINAPNGRVLRR